MIVRILHLAIIAMLLRLVWRGLLQQVTAAGRGTGEPGVGRAPTIYKGLMVKDPVCGLHVPESRALVSVQAGETIHFCSETCRAEYVKAHAR